MAQTFAGFLLMPKLAVCNAFKVRGWNPAQSSPEQIYRISNLFGVTYTALIQHMAIMELMTRQQSEKLANIPLKDIRSAFISDPKRQLVMVDTFWRARAIDLEVGDFILKEKNKFNPSDIQKKGFNDLVSYVDKTSEKKLIKGL